MTSRAAAGVTDRKGALARSPFRSLLASSNARRQRRELSLAREVGILRRSLAVALRDKATLQLTLDHLDHTTSTGVSPVHHIRICQQLHLAEARSRELEQGFHARF